jgi:hypothetical protein
VRLGTTRIARVLEHPGPASDPVRGATRALAMRAGGRLDIVHLPDRPTTIRRALAPPALIDARLAKPSRA